MKVQKTVFQAILLYSICEYQSGNASSLAIEITDDLVSIQDNGRGHALERQIEGVPYLTYVYEHLDWPFFIDKSTSIQLHTLGISMCKNLCDELSIEVTKEDLIKVYSFTEENDCLISEVKNPNALCSGNKIVYKIKGPSLDIDFATKHLKRLSQVCPELLLTLNGCVIA